MDLEAKGSRMGTPTRDRDLDTSGHSTRSSLELTPRLAAAIFSHQGNAGEPAAAVACHVQCQPDRCL